MTRSDARVVEMYDRHPISTAQIMAKLKALRGGLDGLDPSDLYDHDQDHYGGLDANRALARRAGLKPGMRVADFCAGLGGPARFFAREYGVHVTGVELNASRVAGACELTALVGLEDRVDVIEGNVLAVPLPDRTVDAVISQEALLHVPDKAGALGEAWRVLKPGGRLVFTDWIAHRPLDGADTDILWQGLAAQSLQSIPGYETLLSQAGFELEAGEDLTREWADILEGRFKMYRALREETSGAGLPAGEEAFYRAYVRLVDLVKSGALGGGRFTAGKHIRGGTED